MVALPRVLPPPGREKAREEEGRKLNVNLNGKKAPKGPPSKPGGQTGLPKPQVKTPASKTGFSVVVRRSWLVCAVNAWALGPRPKRESGLKFPETPGRGRIGPLLALLNGRRWGPVPVTQNATQETSR